ncbi:hypothetical protein M9Y10_002574 [Tritrichomonas musculus]|uniref:Phosphatidylinositol 3-and 4-kinase family protein n=1 Tax=Tritrichomonas musculus TaxID=1915356 RepID=A0ABR2LA56_9EUKA
MNPNSTTGKSKNTLSQLQGQCLSTSIYSFQALDEVIAAKYQKFHPKISGSSSDLFQPPEDREIEKVNRLLSRLKNQQQLNQLRNILETTQFATVRNRMNDFFLTLFLRPSERETISIPADTIILEFHRFFPFFEEEDQVELLDALSSVLLQVSPSESKSDSPPNMQTYKAVVNGCILTLKRCIKINFPTQLTIVFIKSVLQNSIKIASNLSQRSKSLISNTDYIGEFLPFIAEIEPLMSENDQDMNRLIQQFFITCILFTLDNPNYLSHWDPSLDKIARFIPPLVQRKPKIDFSSTKVRIQELLILYNIQKYRKSEDVIPIFNKYLPGLPSKNIYQLQQMDLADVIYAISIYLLEKMRAERGIFGPILEYIEAKYIPHFSGVLNAMFDPLLNTFYQYLSTVTDLERRNMCASFTMSELIRRFASANLRVQTRVDPILKAFSNDYPIVICNTEVLNSISDTYNELNSNGDQQRIQIFSSIVDKLFSDAVCYVPNSFFAAIFHSQVKKSGSIQLCSGSSSLLPIMQALPQSTRVRMMQEFMLRSVVYGQAQFANEEMIKAVRNDQERFLLSASYVIIHPDSEIITDLIAYNEPQTLMLAWTHVAMQSVEMSKLIVPLLIQTFVDLSKNNVGIFGPKVNKKTSKKPTSKTNKTKESKSSKKKSNSDSDEEEEHSHSESEEEDNQNSEEESSLEDQSNLFTESLVIDEKAVQYQTTLLQFFIENITLNTHYADYASVLICAMDRKFVQHACIVPAIISYAYLGCLIMKTPFKMTARSYDCLQKIIIRLALISYSFTYDDYVLKYVTQRELFLLEQLIFCLPDTLESGYEEHSKIAQSIKRDESAYLSIESKYPIDDHPFPKIAEASFNKVEERYLQNNPFNKNYSMLVKVVAFLLCDEIQIFNAFINQTQVSPSLQRILALRQVKENRLSVSTRVKEIWRIAPEALYPFCKMPRIGQNVLSSIASVMEVDHYTAPSVPMLATLYALSPKSNLNYLAVWDTVPGSKALSLLTPALMKNKISASYVARCFQLFTRRESLLFLPQLVQSLRFDKSEVLRHFLTSYCKQSEIFCHYLLWNILAEKNNPIGNNDNLPGILKNLEKAIIDNMNEQEKKDYENEFGLIDKLDQVSQKLLPMEIDQRPPAFIDMLNEMELPDGLYIPSNPNYKILSIDSEHSVPLKSHARVPILVHFMVYDEDDKDKTPIPFSCIFKIQDDVRQDAMMIQFIDMTRQILTDAGIDHYLFPYRVFATGENRGVIECIQRAKSRHDLGVATNEDLLTYFINKYGQVGTPEFQRAQDNFIKSVAPYSLICYLFQVKDRHNANIMIDEDGHVLHIDFGFIFEISPGGNMKFEKAPFKLTREMIDLMGGSKEAPAFQRFVKLLIQCFFAVRSRHEELESITTLMMNAGFPCFLSDSIKKLQARLFIEKTAKETCTEIIKLVDSAYEATSTTLYDSFQKAQNDIWF